MRNYTLYKKWYRKGDNPKHHFYWWYQYTDKNGNRIRKAAYPPHKPTNILREAKEYVESIPYLHQKADPTLCEYASGFFDDDSPWVKWKKEYNLKDTTIYGHRHFLNDYILKEFGKTRISDLHAREIENWLRGLPFSGATKNTIINTFSIILREAERDGIFHRVHSLRRFKRAGKKKDIFTKDEYLRLFPDNKENLIRIWRGTRDNPDEGFLFAVFMAVMLSGGLRPGEARALHRNQIYEKGLYIDKQLDSSELISLPKKGTENNPRDRIVALPNRTLELLDELINVEDPKEYVFTYHGKPMTKSIPSRRLRDACIRAGLEIENRNIVAYSMRYTYRSRMNNILPRATLMQFMGHFDGSVHDGYLRVIPEEQFRQLSESVYEGVNRFWEK